MNIGCIDVRGPGTARSQYLTTDYYRRLILVFRVSALNICAR